jgi:sugar lactone lactonase YvrE
VLQRQDLTTGGLTRAFPFLDGTDVLSIYRDRQQRLWFGTDKGLYRIDTNGRRKQFGRKDRHEPYLSGSQCERILGDKLGNIWVATWDGFDLYHPESDSFTTALWMNKGENIYAVTQAPDGSFWFGTNMGVKHFSPESETVESFPYAGGAKTGPSDTRINGMLFDSFGVLWIGTQNGLDRYNEASKTFTRVSDGSGLGGQVVSCIQEDSNHHLWLGTNQGVLRFTPSSSAFEQFTTVDGLPGMDLTGWGVCAKGNSKRLYFGGFSGLVSFAPEAVRRFKFVPKILLTDLSMDGVPVQIGPDSLLQKAISYSKELHLPHDRSSFSIGFAALDFRDARVERFRYHLDGIDSTWNLTSAGQHSISFSHLPPGDYTLHIQSAAAGNSPWEEGASLAIHIAPPWWSRWWMLILYLLTLLFILWLERHRKLKQITAVYEARLEGRVRERTRLARDLHDTLLQDFQGLIHRFKSYLRLLDEEDPNRSMIITR